MKIISYYLDKKGILYEIIRTEDCITIKKVIENELKETEIQIGELVKKIY
jgi:hypothetical protein